MDIKFKVFLIYIILAITTSCTISTCTITRKDIIKFPVKGFAKIHKVFTIKKCKEGAEGCMPAQWANVGSGTFVASSNSNSYVMTAGHVCITEVTKEMMAAVEEFKIQIYVQNHAGKLHKAEVIHEEYRREEDPIDLCLLRLEKIDHDNVRIGNESPEVGEKIYAMSSPAGLFHPPSMPLLEGRYCGKIEEYNKAGLTTIPAMGGSSGSAVLNEYMQIVGLIYAAPVGFENASIMVGLSQIRDFLDKGLEGELDRDHHIFQPYPWINHPSTF